MSDYIRLHKGLNIPLKGEAITKISKSIFSGIVAVKPTDFKSLNPKLLAKEGDTVKAGTPVMVDKKYSAINFCSPVSGTIKEIVRGDKRKLLEVRIEADGKNEYLEFPVPDIKNATREELTQMLLTGGIWPAIKQRPYGTIPNPDIAPKAVFISGFDTAPLAPDLAFTLKDSIDDIQKGADVFNRLTSGGVHISLNSDNFAGSPLHKINNVTYHTFDGPHPAGNVGIQIHHISPVNKGDVIWTIDIYSLAAVGRLAAKGIYDIRKTIAITGPRAINPSYVQIIPGASFGDIAEYADTEGVNCKGKKGDMPDIRYISGNILTGDNVGRNGFLGFFHNQITLISEGNYYEMFGWVKPFRLKKFSVSRTYFSWLLPKKKYNADTNLNGGKRPFVMTGLYENVLPMDIHPMFLFKACLAGEIENMEALGIYEVIEEDVALCEFVCPSKTDIQEIISDGINLMIKEMS